MSRFRALVGGLAVAGLAIAAASGAPLSTGIGGALFAPAPAALPPEPGGQVLN